MNYLSKPKNNLCSLYSYIGNLKRVEYCLSHGAAWDYKSSMFGFKQNSPSI